MYLHTLHGFLGLPEDWELFNGSQVVNHLNIYDYSDQPGFKAFAQIVNQSLIEEQRPRVLMGYSLGGRLALHTLIDSPQLWDAAVIISAHPGLQDEQAKQLRYMQDLQWAHRFLQEPWHKTLKAWNAQTVFKGSVDLKREERTFDKDKLGKVLSRYSLGCQKDLRSDIFGLPLPILWMAGECDTVYSAIAKSMVFKHPASQSIILENAGHRLPWDNSKGFLSKLSSLFDPHLSL